MPELTLRAFLNAPVYTVVVVLAQTSAEANSLLSHYCACKSERPHLASLHHLLDTPDPLRQLLLKDMTKSDTVTAVSLGLSLPAANAPRKYNGLPLPRMHFRNPRKLSLAAAPYLSIPRAGQHANQQENAEKHSHCALSPLYGEMHSRCAVLPPTAHLQTHSLSHWTMRALTRANSSWSHDVDDHMNKHFNAYAARDTWDATS